MILNYLGKPFSYPQMRVLFCNEGYPRNPNLLSNAIFFWGSQETNDPFFKVL